MGVHGILDGDGVAFTFNLRFPGQYFDAETGLNYNYFRDYDPKTGRYVESDPIGLSGGLNTYGYVDAQTLEKADPLGLDSVSATCSRNPAFCARLFRQLPGFERAAKTMAKAAAAAAAAKAASDKANDKAAETEDHCPNSNDECDNLNKKVREAKKKVGRLGACRPGMSRYDLSIRKQAWKELAIARARRDVKCWNGGNIGHQGAQAAAWENVGACSRLMK